MSCSRTIPTIAPAAADPSSPARRCAAARAAAAAGSSSLAVLIAAVATVGFGIDPEPLVDFAENAGASIAEMVSQIGESV